MGIFKHRSIIGRILRIVLYVVVAGVCLYLLLRGLIHDNIIN